MWLAGCLAAGHAWCAAPSQPLDLDLPAGPLSDTLVAIAQQAETIVSFQPDLVAGRMAPAISGRLTLEQALNQAAACCGLVVQRAPAGALTLVAADPLPVAAAGPAAADPLPTSPQATLPPVEILGLPRRADGLRPVRGWAASRTDTPLAELPQAVSVLTPEALALQGGSTVVEAMRYVPGVTGVLDNAGSGGFGAPSLLVRGLNGVYAVSGLRSLSGDLPIDLVFVERIEVPKGPSALLGNVVDARGRGGMVNLVLKEAEPLPGRVFTQSLSSHNNGTLRVSSDLGGEWLDDAYWRLIAYASQSGRTEGGYTRQGSLGAMATSTVRRGALTATFMLQAQRRRDTPAPASRGGAALLDGTLTEMPVAPGRVDPIDPGDRALSTGHTAQVHLRWDISPSWHMTLASMVERLDGDLIRHQPFSAPRVQEGRAWNANAQWSLTGDLHSGPVRHTVLLGLDADRWRTEGGGAGVGLGDLSGLVSFDVRQRKQGLVLQDQMAMGPWRLRVAVQRARIPAYDLIIRPEDDPTGGVQVRPVAQLYATNWDGGLLYQWRPSLALYAGFQYSVEGDIGRADGTLPDGSPIPIATVHQLHAGLKGQWFDRKVSWTAEAFRIRQDNVLVPGVGLPVGGRSVDGLEFELAGRLLPRLDLNLGLTLMHVSDRVSLGGAAPMDVRGVGVPGGEVHLLARYHLPVVLGEKSSLGVALNASSSTRVGTPGFSPSGLQLPGGAQLDLSWERAFGPWSVNASVRNAFDRQLYSTASDPRYLPLLPGRSVGLTVSHKE